MFSVKILRWFIIGLCLYVRSSYSSRMIVTVCTNYSISCSRFTEESEKCSHFNRLWRETVTELLSGFLAYEKKLPNVHPLPDNFIIEHSGSTYDIQVVPRPASTQLMSVASLAPPPSVLSTATTASLQLLDYLPLLPTCLQPLDRPLLPLSSRLRKLTFFSRFLFFLFVVVWAVAYMGCLYHMFS